MHGSWFLVVPSWQRFICHLFCEFILTPNCRYGLGTLGTNAIFSSAGRTDLIVVNSAVLTLQFWFLS